MAVVTTQQSVAALYTAIFNRAPDQAGLNFWTAQINGGATFASVAAGFAQHEVFTTGIGALGNAAYVAALYTNILGSAGDTAGIAYWTARLAAGETKAAVVAAFVQGSLTIDVAALQASGGLTAVEAAAALVRQQTLTNKADVGIYFANSLAANSNLNPATVVTSKAGLLADPAYQASVAVIANVTNTAASVQTAKDAIAVAAGSASPVQNLLGNTGGLIFTLTNAADTLSPNSATPALKTTAFNDTIRAADGNLNDGDVLDGGTGTDTLVVTQGAGVVAPTLISIENVNATLIDAAAGVNLVNSTGYTTLNAIAGTVASAGFSNVKLGTAIAVTDTAFGTTFGFAGATGTADAATLTLADVSGNAVVNVAAIENLTVKSTAGSVVAVTSNTANIVDAALQTLTVTGDQALDLTVTAASIALKTVDASALTKAFTLATTLNTAVAVPELTIKGSGQADTITVAGVAASSKAIIDLGAGADTLSIGATAFHKITTGLGADTINLSTAANNKAIVITDSTTLAASVIEITDFTSGSDLLRVGVAGAGTEKVLSGTELQNIASSANLLAATNAAFAAAQNSGATVAGDAFTFQFGSDSYVVVNGAGSVTALDTTDVIIKLTGVTATVATDIVHA